jgi:Ricin-type beta-trefoil lectin domain
MLTACLAALLLCATEPQASRPLVNAAQGMCLDPAGSDGAPGSRLVLWPCTGDLDQGFLLDAQGQLVNAPQKACLTVEGNVSKGASVILDRCTGSASQKFSTAAADSGRFVLKVAGLCVDATGADGKQGDAIIIWSCESDHDQRWSFGPTTLAPANREPGSTAIIGRWLWPQNLSVDVLMDGALRSSTRTGPDKTGTWRAGVLERREFVFVWDQGTTDTLQLTPDGKRLSGTSSDGTPVSATRIGSTPPSLEPPGPKKVKGL